ncbi:MAG: TIGR04211 family SH3 domain-containing protein [Pseudomonadota bacterium]|nr:TIGR04211 family SH3 domain-containing protein [Pseudomonadota bacterium]
MTKTYLLSMLIVGLLQSHATHAESAYITDELTVPLRSGPSGGHRILHRGLSSGTQLTLLDEDADAGFTQVRTIQGTEGWIRTQYLVGQPIAKIQLVTARREITHLKQQLNEAEDEVDELTKSGASQAATNQSSASEISTLNSELEQIKQISQGAIATYEENLVLKEVNARLRDELDDVSEERNLLLDNETNEGIMLGAGLIFLGLIAGVLIKARPQRSAWS